MAQNGKPAMRGHDGLSDAYSLAAHRHTENNPTGQNLQQRRTSPADLFCAADRLERLAGRGDGDNLLRIAARFRSMALEAGRIAA